MLSMALGHPWSGKRAPYMLPMERGGKVVRWSHDQESGRYLQWRRPDIRVIIGPAGGLVQEKLSHSLDNTLELHPINTFTYA